MSQIPRPALILGFAGLIPFLYYAAVAMGMFGANAQFPMLGAPDGPSGLIKYGIVIACFMSGVLWGFATKADERQWQAYGMSVLQALWVFFGVVGPDNQQLSALMVAFILVLVVDIQFRAWALVPEWWLSLRIPLTLIVLLCLSAGFLA